MDQKQLPGAEITEIHPFRVNIDSIFGDLKIKT